VTRVRFLASAQADLRRAREHYASENPIAAHRFMQEVVRALRLVREAPLRWQKIDAQRRRFVLAEFPYTLVYRFLSKEDQIRVVAVAHQHRRPGYWSRR
jgi:toxin ParE2